MVPDGILAVVGDRTIDMRQPETMNRRSNRCINLRHSESIGTGDHLLSLIDEKLIIREAERGGLGEDPEFKESMRFIEHKSMVETHLHQTVGQNIHITEEEFEREL